MRAVDKTISRWAAVVLANTEPNPSAAAARHLSRTPEPQPLCLLPGVHQGDINLPYYTPIDDTRTTDIMLMLRLSLGRLPFVHASKLPCVDGAHPHSSSPLLPQQLR